MIFRLGELFCGPGGIAWGAMNASIEDPNFSIVHQWANDYDADTCETYRLNICPDTLILFTMRIFANSIVFSSD